jgi:hypothetical protein
LGQGKLVSFIKTLNFLKKMVIIKMFKIYLAILAVGLVIAVILVDPVKRM